MHEYLLREPLWLQLWLLWLAVVNTACVLFLRDPDARWVGVAWIGNLITITALFEWNGYNRLLGLSHVVWWTPLLVHLWRRGVPLRRARRVDRWLAALFATNAISLVIDYVDVVRYLLGDRT